MQKHVVSEVSEQRRNNMRAIRSKDTKPELLLRKALWHKGYRYRKNYKRLPGTPDIVLIKQKIAIFVDSEFFHGKDYEELVDRLKKGKHPEYWLPKIAKNVRRDAENDIRLNGMGYIVIHFWGGEIIKQLEKCVQEIEDNIWEASFTNSEAEIFYKPEDGAY